MDKEFKQHFEGLIEKFSELLIGDTSPEYTEKVKVWALYNHIHRTMPNLTAHWNQNHPESRIVMKQLFEEIRNQNQAWKESQQKKED